MALVANLYQDWMCTTPAKTFTLGVAGVTGQYSQLSQWQQRGTYLPLINGNQYYFYQLNAYDNMGFTLGGGSTLYDYDFASQIPYYTTVPTDRDNQNSGTLIYNPMFTGRGGVYQSTTVAFALSMTDFDSPSYQGTKYFTIRMYNYSQVPDSGTRTSWNYRNSSMMFEVNAPMPANTAYPLIKIFQITIENKKFYMLACGVSGSNAMHPAGSYQPTTLFLIPDVYFKDQPNAPYVGPVSKDSAEAFTPVVPHRDSIASRDLTGKKDPYGFNTGNGMKLVVATRETHAQLVKQIYTGYSGNILNALGQAVSSVVGGNDHRNAEEIQQMINCVLCCHLVPKITDTYSGTATTLYTLGGYALFNPAKAVNQVVSQIVEATTTPQRIDPIVNNFLSFAPYCQVSLSVPFVGDISIDPSAIFNSSIYFHFFIDLFTGTLSVDVHLVDDDGRDYIYATRQTNCAIDIPIMGTGATGNPLQKIASAAINGAHYGGAVGAGAGGIFQTVSEASAPHSAAVGRGSTSNMAPYFSCRRCYLVITYPESSNAANYFNLNGGVINKEGTVGDYTGYSEFEAVNLDGITATDQEKRQILELLKGGVFV